MDVSTTLRAAIAGACLCVGAAAGAADDQKKSTAQSQGSQELHKAMMQGMEDMHRMKMSGDADRDFAAMMIEHHEQAIAMSKAQVKNGKDPQVRKKAQEIIAASEKDIADLKKWKSGQQGEQKTAAD